MSIVINVICFALGSLFGVAIMCVMATAKRADKDIDEQEDKMNGT